ncbi:MAG: hypothetical protein AB8G17_02040 [Gammaproteobacteria bacterium]
MRPNHDLLSPLTRYLGSFVLTFALASSSLAGPNTFTGNGPDGGRATVVVADPQDANRVYSMGAGNGTFFSDDGGATWAEFDVDHPDITRSRISDIAIDPNSPSTIWVVDSGSEVVRSTDRGLTWTSSSVGSGAFYIWPDQHVSGRVFLYDFNTLYRSTDNGDTWTDVGTTLSDSSLDSILQSPSDPDVFFALGWDGPYKSVDGGQTWAYSAATLPLTNNGYVFARVGFFDPDDSDIALINISNRGNYRTTDGGATWESYGIGVPNDFFRKLVHEPGNQSRVYMATGNNDLIYSNNGGLTWINPVDEGLDRYTVDDIAFDPTNPSRLLIATFTQGLFTSTDQGASWARTSTGFVNENVESLSIDAATGRIYAGVFGGASVSDDDGANWTHNVGDYDLTTFAMEADPLLADHAYAGSSCCGLYETFDGGATWARINLGLPGVVASWVTDIDIPVSDTQQLLFSDFNRGLFGTKDGGVTWAQLSTGLEPFFGGNVVLEAVKASDNNPDVIYVGSSDFSSGGVFKSTDGGVTWSRKSGDGIPGPTRVFSVAVHPDNPDIVFVGDTSSTRFSTDGGDTWQFPATGTSGQIEALYIDPNNPLLMYAARNAQIFYRSVDGGLNWVSSPVLPFTNRINTLAVDPNDRGRVLIGFDNIGYREYTFTADLDLTADSDSVAGELGLPAAVGLTVTANGPTESNSVNVSTSVDAALVIDSAVPSVGSCSIDGQDLSCDLGVLNAGAAATILLSVTPQAEGDIAIDLAVTSLESDPLPSNNTALVTVSVGTDVDTDGDGVGDSVDNCTLVANASQTDADGDGYGNRCDADLNNDCTVNVVDLGAFRAVFFSTDPNADFNDDGTVNVIDLGLLRTQFFQSPGPSATGSCGS